MIFSVNDITGEIIGASMKVHTALGPGLLESSYKECLFFELLQLGLLAEKEKPLPLVYENIHLEIGYRIDLFVKIK